VAVNVLIVDDSAFARKVIRHHLEQYGCKVAGEADSGAQAVRMYEDLHPDLVTLDVMMPAADGVDSLSAFRAIRHQNPRASILVVTVVPFDKTRDTFMEEGALGFIVKPFNKYSFDQVRMRLARVFPELNVHFKGELGRR
jgi:two-component system, chemotaxis family, chemotaxis protein CheY